MLLAQLTDFHVVLPDTEQGKLMRTPSFLEAALAHVEGIEPEVDAILGTGDLVDAGRRDEYDLLASLLEASTKPVYLIPGNHDDREAMRTVFLEAGHDYLPAQGFLQYCVDLGPLRLVALDTLLPGEPGGLLCEERLQWLDDRLSEDSKPTLVMQHHPPFVTGISQMDEMGLAGSEEEAAVLHKHSHVERVICGHIHRSISRRFGGTIASTAPSTAHAVELDLRSPGRLAVLQEPPGCTLHAWRDNALVTHTSVIGDFGPPYVIHERAQ
jgi:3',5'-cyclic AMP phosphodiesterase CpdA